MRTVKKILLVTLSLCLVLGISACSQQTDSVPDETGNEGQEQTTPDSGESTGYPQGVKPVLLAVSFGTIRWDVTGDSVQNSRAGTSSTPALYNRLSQSATEMFWFDQYKSPCIRYFDDSDQTTNVVWYEDARSVEAKVSLAAMFGVRGVSLWQAGIIPNYPSPAERDIFFDVWQALQSRRTQ